MNTKLLLAALFGVCTVTGFGQEMPAEPGSEVTIASCSRVDQEYRLSLRGTTPEKNGTFLLVRLFPVTRRLSGDDNTIILVPEDAGAVSGRAQVLKGSYTATFRIPVLRTQEVCVTPSGRDEGATYTQRLLLYDPVHSERELRQQVREFLQTHKAVEEFVDELEPGCDSDKPQPAGMGRRFVLLYRAVRDYADTRTLLGASTPLLMRVLMDIGHQVTFESGAKAPSTPPEEGLPYPTDNTVVASKYDPAVWRALLDRSLQVAFREVVIEGLDPLCDLIDRRTKSGGTAERAQTAAIQTFATVILSLKEGGFQDAFRDRFAQSKLPDLLRSLLAEASQSASDDPDAANKEKPDDAVVLAGLRAERERLLKP